MKIIIYRTKGGIEEEHEVDYGSVKVVMDDGIIVSVYGSRETTVAVQPPTFYRGQERLARLNTEISNINGMQAHLVFKSEPRPSSD